ncbi:MAG: hypothetical protein A2010_14840 [Nitrospirae bacterium GWD2_57_9]|nr:MAG: hypothetical protein A2010_14840 [Nitrospirae bacterium GWD2_57_9]OGW47840.1 MAG: hypothetical protein A2078_15810 [Nitrospirae bacterium GWC2_57_9]
MAGFAKAIIVLGVVLVLAGLILLFIQKLPFIGKLPGDIIIKKDNFTFYFPLATSIIISIIVSLVLYLISKFK